MSLYSFQRAWCAFHFFHQIIDLNRCISPDSKTACSGGATSKRCSAPKQTELERGRVLESGKHHASCEAFFRFSLNIGIRSWLCVHLRGICTATQLTRRTPSTRFPSSFPCLCFCFVFFFALKQCKIFQTCAIVLALNHLHVMSCQTYCIYCF